MKFKQGDKVERISHNHPQDPTHKKGFVTTIPSTVNNVGWYEGGHIYCDCNYELVVETPAVPVFDRYHVYAGGFLVAGYETFEEADTRARGLAEGGKIATVKGYKEAVLIATYQRPVPPVEVIFADAS